MSLPKPPEDASIRIMRSMFAVWRDNWSAYLQIIRARENSNNEAWKEAYLKAAELVAAQMV